MARFLTLKETAASAINLALTLPEPESEFVSIVDMDEAALAASLPGSIIELEGGEYAAVPVKAATKKDQAKGLQVKLTTDGHDFGFRTWTELKVKIASIAVGVLTDGNKEGSQAPGGPRAKAPC